MRPQRRLRVLDASREVDAMETCIKVAFASTDMKEVDQHFGAAESFAIYLATPSRHDLVEVVGFGKLSRDGNEDKLAGKIAALEGCAAVYSNAVGASAISKLERAAIQPVKVSPGTRISELLASLCDELAGGASGWVTRALERAKPKDPGRFAMMEAEGWEE